MKIKKLLSAVLSVLLTVLIFPDYVFAYSDFELTFKTSKDGSETIITREYYNTKEIYRLKSDGTGLCIIQPRDTVIKLKNKINIYVTAKIEDISKLPEDIHIHYTSYFNTDEGEYILYDEPMPVFNYKLNIDKAIEIINELKNMDGVSDIHMYYRENYMKCYFYENRYRVFGKDDYDESDYEELIKKGYSVSKLEHDIIPSVDGTVDDYLEIYVIHPEFEEAAEDERLPLMYKTMLDVLNTKVSGNIILDPSMMITGETVRDHLIECSIPGDANFNYVIDLYDAIEIAKYLIGAVNFTFDEEEAADFNEDGNVDLYDAIGIAKTLI